MASKRTKKIRQAGAERERKRERFIFQAMEFVQQDEDKQKFAGTNQTYNKITQIKHITK